MRRALHSIAIVALAGAAAKGQQATPAGDVARGQAAWMANGCVSCHGRQGQGGYGPTIAGREFDWEAFAYIVRNPPRIMPAYTPKTVSDAELADIYAFAKSLPGPRPVTGSSMLTPRR